MDSSTHGRVVTPDLEPVNLAFSGVAAEEAEKVAVAQVGSRAQKEGERFASAGVWRRLEAVTVRRISQ